jgi:hypothetical protein
MTGSRSLFDIMTHGVEAMDDPGKKAPPHANKKEIEERVGEVYALLLNGKHRAEICEYAAEKWGVSERSVERYITRANLLFEEHAAFRREMVLGKALARIDFLYSEMLSAGDYRGALLAVREETDLLGVRGNKTTAADSQRQSLITSPAWIEFRTTIIEILAQYPEAKQAILAAIAEKMEN